MSYIYNTIEIGVAHMHKQILLYGHQNRLQLQRKYNIMGFESVVTQIKYIYIYL